jgi:hypothetical protein
VRESRAYDDLPEKMDLGWCQTVLMLAIIGVITFIGWKVKSIAEATAWQKAGFGGDGDFGSHGYVYDDEYEYEPGYERGGGDD